MIVETEADYMAQVVEHARDYLGYRVIHAPNTKTKMGRWSNQSMTDWPDLVLIRPPRIVFAELKGTNTRISVGQLKLLALLKECGCEAYLWRAGVTTLQEISDILAPKGRP